MGGNVSGGGWQPREAGGGRDSARRVLRSWFIVFCSGLEAGRGSPSPPLSAERKCESIKCGVSSIGGELRSVGPRTDGWGQPSLPAKAEPSRGHVGMVTWGQGA